VFCDCSCTPALIDSPTAASVDQNPPMEQEKRIRREIANSNERRRMQSINAGFQSLRTLLPHHEGEKLSKVSGVPFFHEFDRDCFYFFWVPTRFVRDLCADQKPDHLTRSR
jgi:hypothetical protein